MGKKGTKKKTKWHSLPMEDTSGAAAETHGIHREQTTAEKPFNAWRLPPTKSSSISSQNSNQSADNPQQSNEISSTSHLNGGHHQHPRVPGHRRRNYQQNSYHGRHFGRRSSPSYRGNYVGQNASSRDNSKPAFNEDEYTRITTPRQDVLFKKGYLSRPKRFGSFGMPNDPATTPPSSGSGAVSVTSMDDSATPSTQSISPEHCHSASDASDGDFPFMYPGFFDQNGVLYVNPYTSFDPYGNPPMVMMPYPVNNLNSMDMYNTPVTPYDASCSSVDSQITSPGTTSPHNEESSPATPPIIEEAAEVEVQEGEEKQENGTAALNPNSTNFYPQSLPPFYPPPIYYAPYVFSPPMVPIYDDAAEYPPGAQDGESGETKEGQDAVEASNAVGVEVVQAEEDAVESQATRVSSPCCPEEQPTEAQMNNVIPNGDVSVALKSTLNVEVQEFHPRNYSRHQEEVRTKEPAEGARENSKSQKGTTTKNQVTKKKQPYSQIITNRKLLQEATKSIQAQNIDLSKENPLAAATAAVATSEKKWQTVVKPRGKKGRSVAIEDAAGEEEVSDDETEHAEKEECDKVSGSVKPLQDVQSTVPKAKKVMKPKKKAATKKGKKAKQTTGFEVIEPDFGRIVLNKKTEIVSEEDSEVDGATAMVEDNVIDVCDDAECRKLEAELHHIESILNLDADVCHENANDVPEVAVNGHAVDEAAAAASDDDEINTEPVKEEEVAEVECQEVAQEEENAAEEDDSESISELSEEITEIDVGCDDGAQRNDQEDEAPERIEEPAQVAEEEEKKISLFEAVTLWLDEKQKTNSAEDLFRLPENPVVLQRLYESAAPDGGRSDTEHSDTDDEAEVDAPEPQLKLKNQMSVSEDDSIDTDSDYQSDGQAKNRRPSYTMSPQDNQPAAELTTGSPTNKLTSVNSLNHSSSTATLEAKTSPISCILM